MKIWVSPLSEVHNVAARERPGGVISLLSPGSEFPAIADYADEQHHRVEIHDIREEINGWTAPTAEHVGGVIAYLKRWRPETPLLIHCWAGISRSTATAFVAACMHNPAADEGEIARALRRASPTAWPNTRIVALADEMLSRNGRMAKAIEAIGAGALAEEAEPFYIPARF